VPCYHRLTGYRSILRSLNGKRPIVFDKRLGFGPEVKLPCGQCIGCRLERARQWAVRCMHEASLHDENCFITLTYGPDHLPFDRSLKIKDFQDFMKRLRFKYSDRKIRFFHCGEYGARFHRPHYHACLFGLDFSDKEFHSQRGDTILWRSRELEHIWSRGFCTVGSVSFESAGYVARYVMKKVTGEAAAWHYVSLDEDTGEAFLLSPEYVTMSRRPGIGREWYEAYKAEVFPCDSVVVRGKEMKPPRYYDSLFEIDDPEGFDFMKRKRVAAAKLHAADSTPERLTVREVVKLRQVGFLKRGYEDED